MASIPLDIIFDIMRLLPVKSLLRFRSVCKTWRDLIDSTRFIKSYETNTCSKILVSEKFLVQLHDLDSFSDSTKLKSKSKFTTDDDHSYKACWKVLGSCYKDLGLALSSHATQWSSTTVGPVYKIMGSCNGLLFLTLGSSVLDIALCNPSTRTIIKKVPYPKSRSDYYRFGFGYDCYSHDYKIVALPYDDLFKIQITTMKVLVFSLRSDSWSWTSTNWDREYWPVPGCKYGVFTNNSLHWLMATRARVTLLTFDLHTETFQELPMPPDDEAKIIRNTQLGLFDGCLCLAYFVDYGLPCFKTETWVMKEHGVEWVKFFCFTSPCLLIPLTYNNNANNRNQILFSDKEHLFWITLEQLEIRRKQGMVKNMVTDVVKLVGYRGEVNLCIQSLTPILPLPTLNLNQAYSCKTRGKFSWSCWFRTKLNNFFTFLLSVSNNFLHWY